MLPVGYTFFLIYKSREACGSLRTKLDLDRYIISAKDTFYTEERTRGISNIQIKCVLDLLTSNDTRNLITRLPSRKEEKFFRTTGNGMIRNILWSIFSFTELQIADI